MRFVRVARCVRYEAQARPNVPVHRASEDSVEPLRATLSRRRPGYPSWNMRPRAESVPPDPGDCPLPQLPEWEPLRRAFVANSGRSEEHTSELQSHLNLVCRLLLEKKKKHSNENHIVL